MKKQTKRKPPVITDRTLRIVSFFVLTCLGLIYFLRAYLYIDPDLGWHIQIGEVIRQSGIAKTDPLSYTMPSYRYVDLEWLANVLLSVGIDTIGMIGMALIFGLLPLVTYALVFPFKKSFRHLAVFSLGAALLVQFVSIRPQEFTWLFLAILSVLLYKKTMWQRWYIYLPIFFLIWVNLHAGFIIGLGLLGLHAFFRFISKDTLTRKESVVYILSFLTIILTPYGLHLIHEIIVTLSDPLLRSAITEWKPVYQGFSLPAQLAFYFYSAIAAYCVYLSRKNISFFQISIFGLLFISGFFSRRNIPLFLIATALSIADSLPQALKVLQSKNRLMRWYHYGYGLFVLAIAVISLVQLRTVYANTANNLEAMHYPKIALAHADFSKLPGEIFTDYNWAGYMVWKLPDKKVFVDGRMPTWRRVVANSDESISAFQEYRELLRNQLAIEDVFKKYNIQTVVWHSDGLARLIKYNGNIAQADSFEGPKSPFLNRLTDAGWKKVYDDYITVIYVKPGQ